MVTSRQDLSFAGIRCYHGETLDRYDICNISLLSQYIKVLRLLYLNKNNTRILFTLFEDYNINLSIHKRDCNHVGT